MKDRFTVGIVLLASMGTAPAQLASSHAATAVASQPASTTANAQPAGRPVARVNGAVLTDRDLLREEYTIFPYARQHNGVPAGMEADIRAGALKMIVFEELVYQEAQRRKMTVPATRLQSAEAEFRKQFASQQQFDETLKSEFQGSRAVLRSKIRRSLLIEEFLKQEVQDKSTISVAEAQAVYDKNPDWFRYPESFTFQSISILPPANPTAAQAKEARKRADDALRKAKATHSYEEFGMLAEKISEDDFRVMMGEHQAADRSKLPPPVVNALLALQPGEMSGLVEFDANQYTILRLKEHTSAGKRKFEEVRDALREHLQKKKAEELRRNLDARLRKKAKVEEL